MLTHKPKFSREYFSPHPKSIFSFPFFYFFNPFFVRCFPFPNNSSTSCHQTMTRLSVNINKIALLRNSRGSDIPSVIEFAKDCERYGAQGITVHPRQDERHIRRSDVYDLKKVVTTEFNIEGYPSEDFLKMVSTSNYIKLIFENKNQT